jgi:hypothetical protein
MSAGQLKRAGSTAVPAPAEVFNSIGEKRAFVGGLEWRR